MSDALSEDLTADHEGRVLAMELTTHEREARDRALKASDVMSKREGRLWDEAWAAARAYYAPNRVADVDGPICDRPTCVADGECGCAVPSLSVLSQIPTSVIAARPRPTLGAGEEQA